LRLDAGFLEREGGVAAKRCPLGLTVDAGAVDERLVAGRMDAQVESATIGDELMLGLRLDGLDESVGEHHPIVTCDRIL
jgi:hypothetical protein